MTTKPLEGILVVSLEQAVAAPLASCRLADAGARVIKIERPAGDFARGYDSAVHGEASYFVWLNRGKESIVLNLKEEEEAALLDRMLAKADVFIQNLAPGATERLGFGSEALGKKYPQLVTCDVCGYGDGPYRDMKAYDFLVQSETGLVAISGAPEAMGRIGVSICDIGTGMNAYSAILQALFLRERTGKGSNVKVSLFDTAAEWMTVPLMQYDYGGKAPKRVGMNHPSIAPYGGYKSKEGEMVVISIQNNREWARFCRQVLERPDMADDPRFSTNNARVANRPAMNEVINAVFGRYSRTALEAKLRESAIAYGSVNSVPDFSNHPQLRRRPMDVNGKIARLVASPMITEHDDDIFRSVPQVGEHTEKIRAEFAL
ncbi:MAG: CaiB/BaiF CoA transferase family protein [Ardenticatenaceae bacterium]